jgi:hypothetical protein
MMKLPLGDSVKVSIHALFTSVFLGLAFTVFLIVFWPMILQRGRLQHQVARQQTGLMLQQQPSFS